MTSVGFAAFASHASNCRVSLFPIPHFRSSTLSKAVVGSLKMNCLTRGRQIHHTASTAPQSDSGLHHPYKTEHDRDMNGTCHGFSLRSGRTQASSRADLKSASSTAMFRIESSSGSRDLALAAHGNREEVALNGCTGRSRETPRSGLPPPTRSLPLSIQIRVGPCRAGC